MISGQSNWGGSQPDESSFSGADNDGTWDDWDEFALGLPEEDLWDAFELDDTIADPQPEYGDFWPESDDDEVG